MTDISWLAIRAVLAKTIKGWLYRIHFDPLFSRFDQPLSYYPFCSIFQFANLSPPSHGIASIKSINSTSPLRVMILFQLYK